MYTITVHYHYGLILFFFRRRVTISGSYEQCEAEFRKAIISNFIFGWWGIISFFLNFIVLFLNFNAKQKLDQQAGKA